MTAFIALIAALALQGRSPPLIWELYDGDGRLVLAEEAPDKSRLRTTFECDPGSGVARLTLYGFGEASGFAQFSAGEANGTTEVAGARGGDLTLNLRIDHPAFAAFAADGRLTVAANGHDRRVEVGRPHLAQLRRFAEQCAG